MLEKRSLSSMLDSPARSVASVYLLVYKRLGPLAQRLEQRTHNPNPRDVQINAEHYKSLTIRRLP